MTEGAMSENESPDGRRHEPPAASDETADRIELRATVAAAREARKARRDAEQERQRGSRGVRTVVVAHMASSTPLADGRTHKSEITRSGRAIEVSFKNGYGDVVRAFLDSTGRVEVSVDRDGQTEQIEIAGRA